MPVTHQFISAKVDAGDATIVRPTDWNDTHTINVLPSEADLTVTWTFTAVPQSTAAPVLGNDLTNKTYVDGLIGGSAVEDYAFGLIGKVPAGSGLRYLEEAGVLTSTAAHVVQTAATLQGATIKLNAADAARTFDLEFRVNGVVVETTPIGLGVTEIVDATYVAAVVSTDDIDVRLSRTAGAGNSTFNRTLVILHMVQ